MKKCKCCNAQAKYAGSVEFNKSCEDRRANRMIFPKTGEMVPYYICPNCGFIFTDYCDHWTHDGFKSRIYNSEYTKADSDPSLEMGIKASVSYRNGQQLGSYLLASKDKIKLLDFGAGGNPGGMGLGLIDMGFNVTSYEPFLAENAMQIKPNEKFDVIYSVEVLEHCTDVLGVANFISEHLSEHGLFYFSTLLHPHPAPSNILDSWYISPRNGHLSIFTNMAITLLFRRVGINVVQTIFGQIGFKKFPNFENNIFINI